MYACKALQPHRHKVMAPIRDYPSVKKTTTKSVKIALIEGRKILPYSPCQHQNNSLVNKQSFFSSRNKFRYNQFSTANF